MSPTKPLDFYSAREFEVETVDGYAPGPIPSSPIAVDPFQARKRWVCPELVLQKQTAPLLTNLGR